MAKQSYNNVGPEQFGNYQFITGQTRNRKPYRVNTSYSISTGVCTGRGYGYASAVVNSMPIDFDSMYASKWGRFWKEVHENANLALTLVDHKKSYAMIKRRSLQLAAGISFLGHFNRDPIGAFTRAADAFSMGTTRKTANSRRNHDRLRRKWKHVPRNAADAWLELQFGLSPLMEDIAACIEVLLRTDFDAAPVRVSATRVADYEYHESYYAPAPSFRKVGFVEVVAQSGAKVRQQAIPVVINGDVALAGQLGLLNLPYVLWDAVPFSFLVDWFVPIGNFLSAQTLDYGYTVRDGVYSQRVGGSARATHWFENDTDWASKAHAFAYSRGNGFRLTPPTLSALSAAKKFKGDAWKAATAAALVTQQANRIRHLF